MYEYLYDSFDKYYHRLGFLAQECFIEGKTFLVFRTFSLKSLTAFVGGGGGWGAWVLGGVI